MKKLLLFSLVITSVLAFAYTQTDVDNATYLAGKGIITTQSTTAGYRLDDTITRAEVAGIALKLRGTTLPEGYTCKRYFGDTIRNDWICRAVELAADAGFVSRTNTRFRPQDKITRAEAFSILLKSGNISIYSEEHSIARSADVWIQEWQKSVFSTLVGLALGATDQISGIVKSYDDDQDRMYFTWSPNQPAKRSDIFAAARLILDFKATMSGEVTVQ
jgi:hypothetical protein